MVKIGGPPLRGGPKQTETEVSFYNRNTQRAIEHNFDQLDLFHALQTAQPVKLRPELEGVVVDFRTRTKCRCGTRMAIVSLSAHDQCQPELKCFTCGKQRGFIAPQHAEYLSEFVNQFGPPSAPILLPRLR
jgi:hypothetical protein